MKSGFFSALIRVTSLSTIRISSSFTSSNRLLIPARYDAVFLLGATQHRERALRSQVCTGDDDRIQQRHWRDVRSRKRGTTGRRDDIVLTLQSDRRRIAVGNAKRR